jgi:hypothetical protein
MTAHNPEGSRLPRRLRGLPTSQSLSRTGLTLWASWGAVAARDCQAPTSASNLGPRSQPKSPPPAGLHGPQRELTFHIGLLRFQYTQEREAPGCTGRQSCDGRLAPWPPGGSALAGRASAYRANSGLLTHRRERDSASQPRNGPARGGRWAPWSVRASEDRRRMAPPDPFTVGVEQRRPRRPSSGNDPRRDGGPGQKMTCAGTPSGSGTDDRAVGHMGGTRRRSR